MSKKHEKQHKKEVGQQEQRAGNKPALHVNWKKILFSEITIILLLLIIAVGMSAYFRWQPATLPTTDVWAEQTINNQIRINIEQQIAQQFPNLPQAQRNEYVNAQLQEVLASEQEMLQTQQAQLAAQFASQLQNDQGHTYLLAIDPYIWLTLAENYEANGHFGDEIVDGRSSISLRNGQEPSFVGFDLHPYLIVQTYRIGNVFMSNFTLQRAAFVLPVFIVAFAVIAGFFLGRRIAGNVAGFIAGLIIAVNTSFLARTPAGFSDTDAYLILFPLLIALFYIETLASDTWKRKAIFITLTSFASFLFWLAWPRWWHIATILMGMTAIYFVVTAFYERKQFYKTFNFQQQVLGTKTGRIALTVIAYFLLTGILFVTLGGAIGESASILEPVQDTILGPLTALGSKGVGTLSVWPNVLTTVAELKEGSWPEVISALGGSLFFIIAILGVLLTFLLKTEDNHIEIRYASFLAIWFFGLSLASVIGVRFIALMAAPFAIAFGAFFGILWTKGSAFLSKEVSVPTIATRIGLAIIILLLFITPITAANNLGKNLAPSMDDTWHESLIRIKENSTDAIITSWWDFGHWFTNIAERRVTFDGGNQGRRIYWVGKTLLTNDSQEQLDILRMLNCGQDVGYDYLVDELNDSYQATKLIRTIPHQTKDAARITLQEANIPADVITQVLEKSHCADEELLDQYYIVSQDMIGKASVWGHFGSWDFDRAYVYQLSRRNNYETAVAQLQQEIGLSEDEAGKLYFEATSLQTNREVDNWISPWPSYVTGSARACTQQNNTLVCTINQQVGEQQGQLISIGQAIVPLDDLAQTQLTLIVTSNGMQSAADPIVPAAVNVPGQDEFIHTPLAQSTFPYEVTIGQTADGQYRAIIADSMLARSSFTKLFYFDGLYMDAYTKLSDETSFKGERIIVYRVDLRNEEDN
jgi:dolichyl-diphosphooligosaccharide--protein glycosyltransferase